MAIGLSLWNLREWRVAKILQKAGPHQRPGVDRRADYLRLSEALDIAAQPLIASIDPGLGYG